MKIYSSIDTGKVRTSNQDAYYAAELSDHALFAVVCDGMGGANAGNIASETAVKSVSEYITKSFRKDMSSSDITKMLNNAVISANIQIYDMALNNQEFSGMGTTVVLALVKDNMAFIAHVGDSRIYLVNNEIKQLTRDHSVVQSLIESGKITPEDAKVHPRKNIITRALGAEEEVKVDCGELELQAGDKLLLCTDGLTNFSENDDIIRIFNNTDIADVADELVKTANNNGGGDNITVVIITG